MWFLSSFYPSPFLVKKKLNSLCILWQQIITSLAIMKFTCSKFNLPLELYLYVHVLSSTNDDSVESVDKVKVPFLVHLDQRSRWTIAITWRLSSVICKLFTFQASSPKPLGRLEPNLAGMFLGWSSTKLMFFVPVGYSIWLPRPIICSDWPKFQRSSSLKLMNW
jgi:hypothetical protein